MSTIIKPFTKYIPNINKNLVIYTGVGSLFTLGFIRGCQEFYYWEIKEKNVSADIKHYLCLPVFGLMVGSMYVNPTMSVFAIKYEYDRIKIQKNEIIDEKMYYNNPYFGLFNNKINSLNK